MVQATGLSFKSARVFAAAFANSCRSGFAAGSSATAIIGERQSSSVRSETVLREGIRIIFVRRSMAIPL